ncbi:hypothetical protein INS49_010743 [Diaporthe citri]|uniref:uncharacterized protein n=1 Tax=Diaporthe citri TaxID=83186 RepID=UPI001C7E5139|nr:uncharacterized protein INS49_010743 [Diaporthe citri]KAG6359691.1 hypothetical protein INS49_010743 [Diaporthe citri]
MQLLKLSVFLALAAAAVASPIQLESRSLFGCYRDVAATQVDCLEACGDTSATDCTNACSLAATQGYLACNNN